MCAVAQSEWTLSITNWTRFVSRLVCMLDQGSESISLHPHGAGKVMTVASLLFSKVHHYANQRFLFAERSENFSVGLGRVHLSLSAPKKEGPKHCRSGPPGFLIFVESLVDRRVAEPGKDCVARFGTNRQPPTDHLPGVCNVRHLSIPNFGSSPSNRI